MAFEFVRGELASLFVGQRNIAFDFIDNDKLVSLRLRFVERADVCICSFAACVATGV